MSDFMDDYFTETYHSEFGSRRGSAGERPLQRVINDEPGDRYDMYGLEDYMEHCANDTAAAGSNQAGRGSQQSGMPQYTQPRQLHPNRPEPLSSNESRPHIPSGMPQRSYPSEPLSRPQLQQPQQQQPHRLFPGPQLPPRPMSGFGGNTSTAPLPTANTPNAQAASGMGSTSSLLPHPHTDTYETQLPAEALGAQQLVDFLFHPEAHPGAYSDLSPANAEMRPKRSEIGLPLPLASEPVNPQTGRRLVYFGRGQPPVLVKAEPKNRFLAIAFKPLIMPDSSGSPSQQENQYTTSYGTVLGYSDNNTQIIWHDRSERFASRVSLSDILMIHRSSAMQCKHCGFVLLRPELREHMSTHKKGSGVECGVFTDDAALGMVCGDTGLIQSMVHPKKLGEGAQGVVELYEITQPTAQDEARAGPNSYAYRYQSRHLAQSGRLTKAVLKTMRFDTAAEAWAQYQKSVRFMTVMENPHLVEYLAVQLLPDHRTLRIAMPFYSEGDLSTAVRDHQGNFFQETKICSIALQLSIALSFLHERNPPIVHGDIKVENVMFYNKKEQIVLMDLDASCEVHVTENAVKTALGTAAFMAPETMNNERLMPASDMWSLGVLLYVLTVMPQFPMITDPVTMEEVMLNAPSWASPEDMRAINEFLSDTNSSLSRPHAQNGSSLSAEGGARASSRGVTLGDCVRANVERRGYSKPLIQLIVDLLSYNPWKRPTAEEVGERLTDIMMSTLLGS